MGIDRGGNAENFTEETCFKAVSGTNDNPASRKWAHHIPAIRELVGATRDRIRGVRSNNGIALPEIRAKVPYHRS
ncbi:hypothetical protein [Beijerinckia sp. L45]|uniref:hypothetical protein n=1 Tax=Beijerinckia sp. L45 TaxID=1641855 RepID=UPI00131CD1CE|nr:hypothetical protein [Beijerinckia sp. L45]